MRKISVVIPCFNSENFIDSTVKDIVAVLDALVGYDYEIILISDASPDDVFNHIIVLSKNNPKITGIEFSRNFGQHAALLAGYREATGDLIVSMDDDGQTPAAGIPILLEKLNEGYDVVFARYPAIRQSAFRRLSSGLNQKMMAWLLLKPKALTATSFFVMKKYVCDEIVKTTTPYPYISGLIFRVTHFVGNADIEHQTRTGGESGYTLRKLFSLWMNGLTTFSVKPLRIATILGIISAISGL